METSFCRVWKVNSLDSQCILQVAERGAQKESEQTNFNVQDTTWPSSNNINIPPYVKHKTVMKTRNSHPMKFIPVQTSCDEYKLYSYRPRTIILTGKVYRQISF